MPWGVAVASRSGKRRCIVTTSLFRKSVMASPHPASALPFALSVLLAGSAYAQDSPGSVSRHFETLDVNRDGVLSQYEYDSEAAFALMDDDRSDSLSAAELQAFLGPQKAGTPSADDIVRRSDINDDGALDYEELRSRIELRFQWMDANKDGNVDPAELREAFMVRTFGP